MICIQEKIEWYWEQKQKQEVVIVTTHAFLHPCINDMAVKGVQDIPINLCNRNLPKQA